MTKKLLSKKDILEKLYDYQLDAINKLKTGSILHGGVGSGKSRTAIAYYYISEIDNKSKLAPLFIITTARKRDTKEWEKELEIFSLNDAYSEVVIDSWNNIGKYINVENSFFIFDEQRVVGYGSWVKSFLKITKNNKWILLSATPGDTWSDYIPVFIANGFYKNKTEFVRKHVIYSRYSKFPKIDKYVDCGHLNKLRRDILVDMDYTTKTKHHDETVISPYDISLYRKVMRERWNIYKDEPIANASGLCYILRRVVNSDEARIEIVKQLVHEKEKVIIFYNFDYELKLLKEAEYLDSIEIAEWNGHIHEAVPTSKRWIYLVQYSAGSEGWNCIETDTIIFYSQSYSYKTMKQASGRIDRLNTPFQDLYYYHIRSNSGIDLAINKALNKKKNFNESDFVSLQGVAKKT